MGEIKSYIESGQAGPIQPSFNRSIHIEARPTQLSSDSGALMLRQLLEHSKVLDWVDEHFEDRRDPDLITHPMSELLRTQLLLLAQGWPHADDADGLREDPILRLSVSDRRGQSPLREADEGTPQGLASQPTLSRLLVQAAREHNREVLEEAVLRSAWSRCQLIDRRLRYEELAVDMDALPMPVHGHQAGVEYNGYFHASGYHPLIIGSAQSGDFFGAVLRPGNVHAHDGAEEAILERLDWIQSHLARRVIVRFDAASVSGPFLSRLEERVDTSYVARIRKNARLEDLARAHVERYQQGVGPTPGTAARRGFSLSRTALSGRLLGAGTEGGAGIDPLRDRGVADRASFLPDHRHEHEDDARPGGGRLLPPARPLRGHARRAELHPHAAAVLGPTGSSTTTAVGCRVSAPRLGMRSPPIRRS